MLKSEQVVIKKLTWSLEDEHWWATAYEPLGLYYEVRQMRDGRSRF